MEYKVFPPPPHLQHIVRCFWTLETLPGADTPPFYQSMADASAEIVLQYGGGFKELGDMRLYFRAQKSNPSRLTLGKKIGFFGIRILPSAVNAFTAIPAKELSNTTYDAEVIFGKAAGDLSDQLLNATSSGERIAIASDFLTKILSRKKSPDNPLVRLVIEGGANIRVREMIAKTGYSERQFERRFLDSTGFTAKHLARIIRHQAAKKKYSSRRYKTLAELAYASGYFDQSHFIREFKEFAGMQPREYFDLLNDDNNEEARVIKGLIIGKDNVSTSR